MGRRRIFISHAFKHVADYAGLLDRLSAHECEFYNHSIPFWNPIDAQGQGLAQTIDRKLRGCDAVLVLVTPGIHNSAWIEYEMRLAQLYGKRVIGVWRHGEKGKVPIPASLDDQLYRMVGWNGPSLIQAIEGNYPQDTRVFDIAEMVDRRRLVRMVVSGVSLASIVLIGTRETWMPWLNAALADYGVQVRLTKKLNGPGIEKPAAIGTGIGALLGILSGDPKNIVPFALAGGAIGGTAGFLSTYSLTIERSGNGPQVVDVAFTPAP